MNGIINILKPAGMTSHDAVSFLRRVTGVKRIGHTGTLDPMAAGVLPLCIGSAARITEYLDIDYKQYRCELMLGLTTDTLDIWGQVITDNRDGISRLGDEDILKAFEPFRGMIQQVPPKYSALKVDGKRLYEYARKGQDVEIKSREIEIKNLEVLKIDLDRGRVLFDVACSKGTYIRSICRDVGEILGVGGAMSFLLRTASGRFSIHDSALLQDVEQDYNQYVRGADYPLDRFGKFVLPERRTAWFSNGGTVRLNEGTVTVRPEAPAGRYEQAYCVYGEERFLGVAIYNQERREFKPDKIFKED